MKKLIYATLVLICLALMLQSCIAQASIIQLEQPEAIPAINEPYLVNVTLTEAVNATITFTVAWNSTNAQLTEVVNHTDTVSATLNTANYIATFMGNFTPAQFATLTFTQVTSEASNITLTSQIDVSVIPEFPFALPIAVMFGAVSVVALVSRRSKLKTVVP